MTRYYEMHDDVHVPGRWFLSDPVDRNGKSLDWVFGKATPVQVAQPIRLSFNPHAETRRPVDYSELSIENVPVVHVRIATVLSELAPTDVQIFPVTIEGQPDQFCLVNVARSVKCIDDARSREVERYTAADAELYPERIGEYKSVGRLRIDPSQVGDARIFRTWGWIAIIVSEEIKSALERIGTVGVTFHEV